MRLGITIVLVMVIKLSLAQFNDPLFNLSVSKSQKLKKEKQIVDSVTTAWYNELNAVTLNSYQSIDDTLPVFDEPEVKAEYEGGFYKLIEFIDVNKPKSTDTTVNFSGLVVVKFIISDKGDAISPQIVYSECEFCNDAVKQMVYKFPKWKPAYQYDIKVYSYYTIPIRF